jgi:hypothetical protein
VARSNSRARQARGRLPKCFYQYGKRQLIQEFFRIGLETGFRRRNYVNTYGGGRLRWSGSEMKNY